MFDTRFSNDEEEKIRRLGLGLAMPCVSIEQVIDWRISETPIEGLSLNFIRLTWFKMSNVRQNMSTDVLEKFSSNSSRNPDPIS